MRADEEDTAERLRELAGPGRTVLFVGSENHVCGLIAVADRIRDDARRQVEALHAAGLRTVMLTGDNRPTAESIAREVGIDEVEAELLPEQKVEAVGRLHQRHGPTAMVGDGINDTPAMARSDLGIAMAAAGSDAAIETADVALMTDELSRLPWLVSHSRRTLGIIRQNIGAAILVKAAFVVLTMAGPASLWAAIAADMGTSLAVVFNALRLLRDR
jgi:Cd2+/Zn2+-exporting ATPase